MTSQKKKVLFFENSKSSFAANKNITARSEYFTRWLLQLLKIIKQKNVTHKFVKNRKEVKEFHLSSQQNICWKVAVKLAAGTGG